MVPPLRRALSALQRCLGDVAMSAKSDMLRLLREATVGVLDTEDLDYLEYELGLGGGTLGGHP